MNQKQNRIIDTRENTEIVYLYVHSFQWSIAWEREEAVGHPFAGRLYRAILNKETGTYRLVYQANKQFGSVYVDVLENSDETKGYTSNIKRLSLDNILDLNLSEEDVDSLNNWIDTGNKDLLEVMWGKRKQAFQQPSIQVIPITGDNLPQIMAEFIKGNDPAHAAMLEKIYQLKSIYPTACEVIGVIVDSLLREKPSDSPLEAYWLSFDENHGAGANISSAIQKLSKYVGSDRRTNLMEEDLVGSIKDLMKEVERRILLNLK